MLYEYQKWHNFNQYLQLLTKDYRFSFICNFEHTMQSQTLLNLQQLIITALNVREIIKNLLWEICPFWSCNLSPKDEFHIVRR